MKTPASKLAAAKRYKEKNKEKVKLLNAEWAKKNRAYVTEKHRQWKKNNPDKVEASRKKYAAKNKEYYLKYMRSWRRKQLPGPPPYEPPANCEACGRNFESAHRGANLDHCHLTGVFRGWLCNQCNNALGLVGGYTRRSAKVA